MMMMHDRGFMGIEVNWNIACNKKVPKKVFCNFCKKNRKFKMAVIFGKNFVKK